VTAYAKEEPRHVELFATSSDDAGSYTFASTRNLRLYLVLALSFVIIHALHCIVDRMVEMSGSSSERR
jgi:hypothetical protein